MYCVLVTGIPAAGKSTAAAYLSRELSLPVLSKDRFKELLYDRLGFSSREEKVRLGLAAMDAMYYAAGQLMEAGRPFILENNFENVSREGLMALLGRHPCTAITVTMTGDYEAVYRRFVARNDSPDRHPGHVFNDHYPHEPLGAPAPVISLEQYVESIRTRGMDSFTANGPRITVDTTELSRVDLAELAAQVRACIAQIEHGEKRGRA